MGFKWFKARMTMNRMPANSSAVAGSYRRTSMFDVYDNTSSNDYPRSNGQIKREQTSNLRSHSVPVLNNPMAGIRDRSNGSVIIASNNYEPSGESSTRTNKESQLDRRNDYSDARTEDPVLMTKETLEQDYNQNIGKVTPKLAAKIHKTDYRKKKVKAPAPKIKLSTSSTETSENGSVPFVVVKNDRKTSHDSDIDV